MLSHILRQKFGSNGRNLKMMLSQGKKHQRGDIKPERNIDGWLALVGV